MFMSLRLTIHDVKRYTPRLQYQIPCEIPHQRYPMTNFGKKEFLSTTKFKSRKVRNTYCARLLLKNGNIYENMRT